MKIAHEAPLSIFDRVQVLTDYDYALVHLFEENEEYYNTFVKAKKDGREVLLDNSIFELGTAFDGDVYADWIVKLKPDWYIVPDVLDNASATIDSFDRFISTYAGLPGKVIAVAQGSTYDELVTCYTHHANNPLVDKIALSFNHPFYQPDYDFLESNKYFKMMNGRQNTIANMFKDGIINTSKPHHLFKIINDYDLITERYISIYEIYNGCIFTLEYFNKRKISIRSNPNIFNPT